MTVLVTGSKGFIAKNLIAILQRDESIKLLLLHKENEQLLESYLQEADFIFHLAGVNRPDNVDEFYKGNAGLTEIMLDILQQYNKSTPILLSSSTQIDKENDYGKSKLQAEELLLSYANKSQAAVFIYRLPNVFGKWSKPNYNTVIATWCYNMTHDLPITINDDTVELSLVYIDDVINAFLKHLNGYKHNDTFYNVEVVYHKSLGDIVSLLNSFKESRKSLIVPNVGSGFERALYASYLSFLDPSDFSYELKGHQDDRGTFYEIVKTLDAGQFSISTTKPGITRGNHYHDSKNEKFLVIKGEATIEHRHVYSEEIITYKVSDQKMEIVEMIPGYTHNITNSGDVEMVLLIWANEQFDVNNSDTHFLKV